MAWGVADATARLDGLSVATNNELLFQNGIIFNYLRLWQRRGVGLVRETYERPATNPKTGQLTSATRRRIRRLVELPMKDAYSDFLRQIL